MESEARSLLPRERVFLWALRQEISDEDSGERKRRGGISYVVKELNREIVF